MQTQKHLTTDMRRVSVTIMMIRKFWAARDGGVRGVGNFKL